MNKQTTKKLVVFDFDGVIVDSIDFSFGINKKHSPKLTRKEWEDMNLRNFYDNYTKKENKIYITIDEFYEEYEPLVFEKPPVVNIDKVIKKLSENYNLAVASGSPARIIEKYLEKYELRNYFGEILGQEHHLSKHEKLKTIKKRYNAKGEHCLKITDTNGDIHDARRNGIHSIAVTWGMFRGPVLMREKPFSIVNKPEEIIEVVESFFNKGILI